MRYRAAAGVGEEAHSRQPHWCPWSKLVNVETWGHVSGPIHSDGTCLHHDMAELRYGIAWHTSTKAVSNVGTFPLRPFTLRHVDNGQITVHANTERYH